MLPFFIVFLSNPLKPSTRKICVQLRKKNLFALLKNAYPSKSCIGVKEDIKLSAVPIVLLESYRQDNNKNQKKKNVIVSEANILKRKQDVKIKVVFSPVKKKKNESMLVIDQRILRNTSKTFQNTVEEASQTCM